MSLVNSVIKQNQAVKLQKKKEAESPKRFNKRKISLMKQVTVEVEKHESDENNDSEEAEEVAELPSPRNDTDKNRVAPADSLTNAIDQTCSQIGMLQPRDLGLSRINTTSKGGAHNFPLSLSSKLSCTSDGSFMIENEYLKQIMEKKLNKVRIIFER